MERLAGIPAALIHGRYDVSGPPDVAWQLHRAWPGSELALVDRAGHGGGAFPSRITTALDRFSELA
jgi:proline iminopeptidase